MKYLFSNSISGQRQRQKLIRFFRYKWINWRLIGRCFVYAMAVIGTVLFMWVAIVAYFIALGTKFNM